jgi:hypothetical protein
VEEATQTTGRQVEGKKEPRTTALATKREQEWMVLETRSQHDCFQEARY